MFGFLIEGIMELKSFLSFNFIENDTHIKRTLNDALNGKLPLENKNLKKSETDN
tara:strand:+ start:38216 stop:38377 length:162 start_codon:yes stop_codon:yes gene_type:complete